MPNYCNNQLLLTHSDKKMILKAIKGFRKNNLMTEFCPCPKELTDTMTGSYSEGYHQELLKFKQELNIKYFGYQDWYAWNNANWGTKWDVGGHREDINWIDAHNVRFSFDSAWCPPIAFYEKLEQLGFTVSAYYFEGGMAFCGMYSDGIDDCYDIEECKSQWIIDNIPEDIDNAFCISEQYAQWEEENQEENVA
jgi:hypothetical protein